MKYLLKVCAMAVVVLPTWVRADEPAPEPTSLATVEAILDYCAKADSPSADKYKEQIKLVSQGASEEALAKARKSDEYRQVRESMEEVLTKVDAQNAKKVCAQHLAQGQ